MNLTSAEMGVVSCTLLYKWVPIYFQKSNIENFAQEPAISTSGLSFCQASFRGRRVAAQMALICSRLVYVRKVRGMCRPVCVLNELSKASL